MDRLFFGSTATVEKPTDPTVAVGNCTKGEDVRTLNGGDWILFDKIT